MKFVAQYCIEYRDVHTRYTSVWQAKA